MTRREIVWGKKVLMVTALLLFSFATSAFAQTGNAQLGGTVTDQSNALIPGVTVTATNVNTNVAQTTISNESGAYSFPVLQPGTYRVTGSLPGFKQAVFNDVELPYAGQVRINILMQVGVTDTTVEVTVEGAALLRQSSASVGDVLSQNQIQNLPLVGNNILDLLATLPGLRDGGAAEGQDSTINGLGMNTVNTTRDGMSINDARNSPQVWGTRVLSQTALLPELVGEIRMIVAPVDAEMGRGNTQVQIATRSGTNRYTGSASWNVRNSALDANTWTNNHTPFTDPFSGERFNSTPKTWSNLHQVTLSYGGPVKIPGLYDGSNKTFFYGVYSQNIRNSRDLVSTTVLTDTARLGIYRYWSGYNPLGWNPGTSGLANPVYPQTATNASLIAVDVDGKPVRPLADPTSPTNNPTAAGFIPYSGNLICFSVFGTQRLNENGGMVPFTPADCPGGQAVLPTGRSAWDAMRPIADTTGLIAKFVKVTPKATYFGSGDGLNTAQVRFIRGRSGDGGTITSSPVVGNNAFVNIKQYNIKIDQNFTSNHKLSASWTHQRDNSGSAAANYPNGLWGTTFRYPHTLTLNGTSTLGSRMVNEARFGINYTKNLDATPWENPDESIRSLAREYLLPAGTSVRNPDFQYLALVNSGIGNISTSSGFMSTTAAGQYVLNKTYNLADTLSWSTGKHAFKFGGDWSLPRSSGTGASQAYPTITLGNASNTASPSPFGTAGNFNTPTDGVGYLPGLLNAAPPNSGVTAARTNVTNLMYYLSGSVASVNQNYWITSSDNVTQTYWDDISTQGQRVRKQISQEIAFFAKDDYKITKRLTLNLGVRWDFFGSPYIEGGFTSIFRGQGYGAFGPGRIAKAGSIEAFEKDAFAHFLQPGNLYLTGYGSNVSNPLSCQAGVKQNALLPASTCDPNALAVIDFVGPGSPNPGTRARPTSFGNIGPAIGFAYQLPWFGEGKTTIRGGYQQTFGSGGTNRTSLNGGTESILANAPGAVTAGTLADKINSPVYQSILANRAITLADYAALVPMAPNQAVPGAPLPIYAGVTGPGAGVNWNVYDPNLKDTYTQNITLSVSRSVSRKFTVDARYTGTLGRRLNGTLDINQNNVYHNPELFQALTDARAGTCTANAAAYKANYTDKGINPCNINGDPVLLDQMLAGLNLNVNVTGAAPGSGTYGAVGTVNAAGIYQSGAQHLRRSTAFQNNLSWGNFDGVADSLLSLAPTAGQGRQPAPIDPRTGGTMVGIAQIGLRNSCDRMGNGFSIVQQTTATGAQVANSGAPIPLRCFPEDWLRANPQFGTTAGSSVIYNTNTGRSNYHSLQLQVTMRATAGISGTATWVMAKSYTVPGSGYYNPADRNLNYGRQTTNPHTLRMNGTVELPIGPNKLLLGNSSGLLARIVERWQTSFIVSARTGTWSTFNPGQSHYYAISGYDVASPNWVIPKAKMTWIEGTTGGTIYPGDKYIGVTDPSCFNPSIVTMGDRMGTVLGRIPANPGTGADATGPCSILALAARNPDGTAGEILLQYPEPGKVGNLGRANLQSIGAWSFDMNASKTFQVSESKSFQIRIDATNVLNHPNPGMITLGASNFGGVSGKGNQIRQVQGQLRINF
jgi:hypothetical protein